MRMVQTLREGFYLFRTDYAVEDLHVLQVVFQRFGRKGGQHRRLRDSWSYRVDADAGSRSLINIKILVQREGIRYRIWRHATKLDTPWGQFHLISYHLSLSPIYSVSNGQLLPRLVVQYRPFWPKLQNPQVYCIGILQRCFLILNLPS